MSGLTVTVEEKYGSHTRECLLSVFSSLRETRPKLCKRESDGEKRNTSEYMWSRRSMSCPDPFRACSGRPGPSIINQLTPVDDRSIQLTR